MAFSAVTSILDYVIKVGKSRNRKSRFSRFFRSGKISGGFGLNQKSKSGQKGEKWHFFWRKQHFFAKIAWHFSPLWALFLLIYNFYRHQNRFIDKFAINSLKFDENSSNLTIFRAYLEGLEGVWPLFDQKSKFSTFSPILERFRGTNCAKVCKFRHFFSTFGKKALPVLE